MTYGTAQLRGEGGGLVLHLPKIVFCDYVYIFALFSTTSDFATTGTFTKVRQLNNQGERGSTTV